MHARIEAGRIRISFSDETGTEALGLIHERLGAMIASATPSKDDPREISCALGVHNFRKLRSLGCKLSDDPHTRECVERMRKKLDRYEEESRAGAAAKTGKLTIDYQFKVPPLGQHQVQGFQFLHSMKEPGLFGDVGCGKTFMVATFADSLVKAGQSIAFLVICPVNLVEHVWIQDIARFTDLSAVSLRDDKLAKLLVQDFDEKGDPEDRADRARLREARRLDPAAVKKAKARATKRHNKHLDEVFAQTANVYVINPEQLLSDAKEKRIIQLCKRLISEGKEICLIVDESSKIKSRTSKAFRSLKKIRVHCARCIIMTGSPSPNGITDLWAQFNLLDGGMTLQSSFIDFRNDYCKEIALRGVTWVDKRTGQTKNAMKWHPKPGAAMQVHRLLEPRVIRFRTQDCIDLPPKRFITREVPMSAEQIAVYDAMENMLFTEIDGESVTARAAVVKLMKLREITGGFIRTDTGNDKPIGLDSKRQPNPPKMIELDILLEQSIADKLGDQGPPSKALVWAQYQWECRELVQRYATKYGARGLFGGISQTARDEALRKFKSDARCRLLVCHPASVGHGLNLTEADFVFYYSLSHNFDEFYQSHARNARPGQKRTMTYYFLVSPGTIDEELIDAIRNKKDLSDIIADGRLSREQFFERRRRRPPRSTSWSLAELPLAAGGHPAEGNDPAGTHGQVGADS